jgi:hypothetical protein
MSGKPRQPSPPELVLARGQGTRDTLGGMSSSADEERDDRYRTERHARGFAAEGRVLEKLRGMGLRVERTGRYSRFDFVVGGGIPLESKERDYFREDGQPRYREVYCPWKKRELAEVVVPPVFFLWHSPDMKWCLWTADLAALKGRLVLGMRDVVRGWQAEDTLLVDVEQLGVGWEGLRRELELAAQGLPLEVR